MRVVREVVFDEFFQHQLPDEGFTLDELYDRYFGLIHEMKPTASALHGYSVDMKGDVIVPRLRPDAISMSRHSHA